MPIAPHNLIPFVGNPSKDMPKGLPIKITDYMAQVDWTGKQTRHDKRGTIITNLPPLLSRLNFEIKSGCIYPRI